MDELQDAIKKTKEYAHRYGQILSEDQLFLRLISPNIYHFSKLKKQKVNDRLNSEWKNKVVLVKKLVTQHLSKFKGIEMVGITGSVAAELVDTNEDIDLIIITKKDELWWWRLYLRFYVWWHKIPHRRFGEKEKKDEFCFNLWLDEANLTIPKQKRNLKNAMDLVMMKVIFDKNKSYRQFLRENKWVSMYLATGYNERIKNENPLNHLVPSRGSATADKEGQKNLLINFIKKIINRVLFWWQYLYMWSKQRKKLKNINFGQAFFHKDD